MVGLTKSGEPEGQRLKAADSSADLKKAKWHWFYSYKEMNSPNSHMSWREDPKPLIRSPPQLTP